MNEARSELHTVTDDMGLPRAGSGKYLNTDMLTNAYDRQKTRASLLGKAVDAAGDKGSYWDEAWKLRGKGQKSIGGNMLRDAGGTALDWFGAADWGKAMGGPGGMKRMGAVGLRAGATWGAMQVADFLNPFGFGSISD
jgi:hypothetical protein